MPALLACYRKHCPSDDELVPSPDTLESGEARCESTRQARAVVWPSSRIGRSRTHPSWRKARWKTSREVGISSIKGRNGMADCRCGLGQRVPIGQSRLVEPERQVAMSAQPNLANQPVREPASRPRNAAASGSMVLEGQRDTLAGRRSCTGAIEKLKQPRRIRGKAPDIVSRSFKRRRDPDCSRVERS